MVCTICAARKKRIDLIWKKLVHFIIMCLMQNRCSTAEARLAAMKEQSESAKEEAAEWKRKHEAVAVETKEVIERTISQKDKAIKQAQVHEDTLRAEYTATVSRKVNDPFEREHVLCAHPHSFAATFFMTVGGNCKHKLAHCSQKLLNKFWFWVLLFLLWLCRKRRRRICKQGSSKAREQLQA